MTFEYSKARTRPRLMDRSMETSLDEGAANISMVREENIVDENSKQLTKDTKCDRTPVRLVSC